MVVCHVFVVVLLVVFVFVSVFVVTVVFIFASGRTVPFRCSCQAGFLVMDVSACATDRRSGLVQSRRAMPVSRFTTSAAMLTGAR